jgi:uncharacterized protein YceK
MKIAVFAVAALLTGCVTIKPQSIGRDTYIVETYGTNMTYGPSLKVATSFCAKSDKKVQVVTTNKGGIGPSANTTLTFLCLDESDPRYQASVMRPDNGVTTIENR